MKKDVLIVDGYNMIGAWPELVYLKKIDEIAEARNQLLHQLSNYQRYANLEIYVVFDAQFVPGIQSSFKKYTLNVIFTSEGETADSYIERMAGEMSNRLTQVTVATSDLAEQWLIFSKGALRKSAMELYRDLENAKNQITADTKIFKQISQRRKGSFNAEQLEALGKLRDALSENKKK